MVISWLIEERLITILSCMSANTSMIASFIGENSAKKKGAGGDDGGSGLFAREPDCGSPLGPAGGSERVIVVSGI